MTSRENLLEKWDRSQRAWATSGVILGVLYFGITIQSLLPTQVSQSVQLVGTIAIVRCVVDVVGAGCAMAFVIGGIARLQNRPDAAQILRYTRMAAIACTAPNARPMVGPQLHHVIGRASHAHPEL